MTLLRREPRSVYRVYTEDEYFDGEHPPVELEGQQPARESEQSQQIPPARGRWSANALLVAALIVIIASVALVIVVTHGRGSHRRPLAGVQPAPVKETSPRSSRSDRYRRRARVHRRAPTPVRPRPKLPQPPIEAAVVPVSSSQPPDPQPEFGFER